MFVEMRSYTFHPGGMKKYVELMQEEGIHIIRRYLPEPIAFYTTTIGDLNRLVHLWPYESLEDREQRRAARGEDPEWQAYLPKIYPLISYQTSTILNEVPMPPP